MDCPQQIGSTDCGIYLIAYAYCFVNKLPMNFNQKDILNFRRQIFLTIINDSGKNFA